MVERFALVIVPDFPAFADKRYIRAAPLDDDTG
jgi:hypothetical protein